MHLPRSLPNTVVDHNGERGLVPIGNGDAWSWHQCSALLDALRRVWPNHPWVVNEQR